MATTIYFFDETGINPLPAGLFVSAYAAPTLATPTWTYVGSGITGVGGIVSTISLSAGSAYGASFLGVQAPAMCSAHFTANPNPMLPTTANASNYRSPSLSVQGYTNEQMNLWPANWFSAAATSPGGNAYALAFGLASALAALDLSGQALLASMRVQTSSGAFFLGDSGFDNQGSADSGSGFYDTVLDAIDTWAADFFGQLWTRLQYMGDAQWIAMIQSILQIEKTTIPGFNEIMAVFWPWIYQENSNVQLSQVLGCDVATGGGMDGNIAFCDCPFPFVQDLLYVESIADFQAPPGLAIGFDTYGGADGDLTFMDAPYYSVQGAINPIIFDTQSNPTLAAIVGLGEFEFCVYFQDPDTPDADIYTINSFSPLLTKLVANWRAAGTVPIFATNQQFVFP